MIINPGLQSRTVILVTSNKKMLECMTPRGRGGGTELPCMGYIGVCGPKGYGFSAVLVINRVFKLILAILVINRVWFLHSSLDMGTFLRRSHFFIIIEKKINKSPSQIMFTVI